MEGKSVTVINLSWHGTLKSSSTTPLASQLQSYKTTVTCVTHAWCGDSRTPLKITNQCINYYIADPWLLAEQNVIEFGLSDLKLLREWGWVLGLSPAWNHSSVRANWPFTPAQNQGFRLWVISPQEWRDWMFQVDMTNSHWLLKNWSRLLKSFVINQWTFPNSLFL